MDSHLFAVSRNPKRKASKKAKGRWSVAQQPCDSRYSTSVSNSAIRGVLTIPEGDYSLIMTRNSYRWVIISASTEYSAAPTKVIIGHTTCLESKSLLLSGFWCTLLRPIVHRVMTHGRLSATLISVLLVCFSLPIPAPRSDNLALRMLWLTQQPDKPNCRTKEDQTLEPSINNESRFSSGRDTSNSENVFVTDFNNEA